MSDTTITIYQLQQNNFDFGMRDYEIFDEAYRPLINKAILDYYKWREICYQNPARWRDALNNRLDLIFRNKYNMLYKIKQTEFNPLYNIEIKETFEHELKSSENSSAKATDTGDSDTLQLSSSYPSEQMTKNDFDNFIYVDGGGKTENKTKNSTESEGNTSNNTIESYTRKTEGSSAGLPFSKALIQFQQFVNSYNLDQKVIDELKDLFITVF